MPTCSRDSAFLSPTPSTRVTGVSASDRRERAIAAAAYACRPPPERLFDAEQIGIERLAAVMHFRLDAGAVLVQPLGDAPRLAGRPPLALYQRHDLVVVGHELGEKCGGGLAQRGGHDFDAGRAEAEVVALVDRTGR